MTDSDKISAENKQAAMHIFADLCEGKYDFHYHTLIFTYTFIFDHTSTIYLTEPNNLSTISK